MANVKSSDILLILLAILFPPASVALITGCSSDLFINILLTVLGYLPGHIHAFWIIYRRIKAEELYGPGAYEYLGNGEFQGRQGAVHPPPPHGAQQPYYGSTQ